MSLGTKKVVPNRSYPYISHLMLSNVIATAGYMVIDLNNSNWPHIHRGIIEVEFAMININPDTTYAGDVMLGWLSGATTDHCDFHMLQCWHLERKGVNPVIDRVDFGFGGRFRCHQDATLARWYGPTNWNDTIFQTDTKIQGPNNGVNFYPGNGDLVLRISVTAGAVDVGLIVGYDTAVV